jgi:hypothetical protein
VNTYVIDKKILYFYNELNELKIIDGNIEAATLKISKLFEKYRSEESYVSLTVNHDDLTNIEDIFAELIGNLSVNDIDGARVTKNRLLRSLEHLRRLSGINLDSVI